MVRSRSHDNRVIEYNGNQWIYNDTKKPIEHGICYDCGLEYSSNSWVEAVVPDDYWNIIKPDGCANGCGLLCITCMARKFSELGFSDVPVWLCGMEPFRTMTGDPGDGNNIKILRESLI